ncbi:UDP-N-acetylmuramoyl-L-alanine--D-glutamate ligase [Vibrio sp. SCSIO 43136]|uniref:UDP-N-acetylmuramoyl-L-alanine--D-glutamate ligase n=1 Tax=Vibrio sp. SCSIO 43136 TaxID=2819101 RepID=UPI0020750E75|nr:UDP-N-acetylmuramoyl-L-alanine--D-glutamate ligase [Vibrio sp. SCSIO 43136]USD66709.1 UDP-N-acetylmuramoyl-L-alanine--D-glutamate ligase [Vibrio sp. SCSIO 43136]
MSMEQGMKNVLVVGLGITGLSVVRYLHREKPKWSVKVIDTRENPAGAEHLPDDVELHCGGWQQEWLMEADLIVANPGIALATPELQPAIAKGTAVIGDIELFAQAVQKPVIAITGSNGKSTVTDLTGVMANACGVNTAVGGNIGVPALDLLEQDADLYVLELSSFQLETTSSLKLVAAAYLNLSEDHMDRYQGMADYGAAKQRIFAHSQVAVVNRQDKATFPNAGFGGQVVTFGQDQGEFGLIEHQGKTWLAQHASPIIVADELALIGQHNLSNALVVMALLTAAGIDYQQGMDALRSYCGLTHRCQVVAQCDGVKWVNDSKATNLASTLAALSGLECAGTLHLLVGGDGKGADFTELAKPLAQIKVELHCYGRDGEAFMDLHPSAQRWQTMDEALANIAPRTTAGDIVMLSPACASFDQYPNFMKRGDAFTGLAQSYCQG